MPKRREKDKKRGERASVVAAAAEPDEAANGDIDNCSVVSNQSGSQGTVGGSDDVGAVDESGSQEIFTDKLKDLIDGISAKSLKERTDSLKGLISALSHKYLVDFLADRSFTLFDALERCMRRGKGEDVGYAAHLVALLFIIHGNTDSNEETYKQIYPTLAAILSDPSASPAARCHCADALAVTTFVACSELEQTKLAMRDLEGVFKASYLKGDHSTPIHKPEVSALHTSALQAWSLLVSILLPNTVDIYIRSHLSKLSELLTSADVELRIAAGETVALLYELAREQDEDFAGENLEELCLTLKQLATDSNKYRAKKDRRQQRSSFRDILSTVEEGIVPSFDVHFGVESVSIDSWARKRQYDMLCHILNAGVNTHLQENVFIREVFGLGAPIPTSALASMKLNKAERRQCNAMAFKLRTRDRAKTRDKRVATVDSTDT